MDKPIVKQHSRDSLLTNCQYCDHPETPNCRKLLDYGYRCTRKKGHDGPCVACGANEQSHDLTHATEEDES